MAAYEPLKGKNPVSIDGSEKLAEDVRGPLFLALALLVLPTVDFAVLELEKQRKANQQQVDQAQIDALRAARSNLQKMQKEAVKSQGDPDAQDEELHNAIDLLEQTVARFPDAAHQQWSDLAPILASLRKQK